MKENSELKMIRSHKTLSSTSKGSCSPRSIQTYKYSKKTSETNLYITSNLYSNFLKTMSTISQSSLNNKTLRTNRTNKTNRTIRNTSTLRTQKPISGKKALKNQKKNIRKIISSSNLYNLPTSQNLKKRQEIHDFYNEKSDHQKRLTKKMEFLEVLIGKIKKNAYQRYKDEIIDSHRRKNELETSVSLLTNKLNSFYLQKKNYKKLSKSAAKEQEMINESTIKISSNKAYFDRLLTSTKNDVEKLKSKLKSTKKKTEILSLEAIEIERSIFEYKDRIKELKNVSREIRGDNERLRSNILLLKRHNKIIKEKILKEDLVIDKFFEAMITLAKRSEMVNKEETLEKKIFQKKLRRIERKKTSEVNNSVKSLKGRNKNISGFYPINSSELTQRSKKSKSIDKSSYTKHTTRENYSDLYGKFYRRKVSGGDTISSTLRRSMNYFYNPQKDCLLAN